ncbi:NmrA-like family protein [Astrocystis sublimbata]|nr:NmrA-like family protein [Astrocystis sublimbata]KAI0196485.1 NmrA-like family protein [Astrocystis sublimbata]
MALKTVTLFGPNGNLGTKILEALLASGHFSVTVTKRISSPWTPPSSIAEKLRVQTVDDELSLPSLKAALQGQDAVVVSIPLRDLDQHLRIADAAAAVGVRRFIPADYGSCDSDSARAQELVPLFKRKADVRARLQEHATSTTTVTDTEKQLAWTSIVCGHFFDWGLREAFLHFDLQARTAEILDQGTYKSSNSTLRRVAEAVVTILARDAPETRNKVLFVQSFCVSQLDVLAALQKASGQEWKVDYVDSEKFITEKKAKADAGDKQAVEDLVFALGALDGDWTTRENYSMELLGLEDEDLDDVVKTVWDSQ